MLDGIDLDVAEGTIFALLGPNGAGKTTIVQILSTLIGADAGTVRVAGHDLAGEPDAVRAAIGVTGQFSAVDNLLTGQENLHPDGRPAPPRPRRGPAAGGRAARALRPGRRGDEVGGDVLRRHAAPARPGDDAGRRPADHLPRRADHRARPAQPPHDVAEHPRARRRRRHGLPDHAVPGGGRPARRPDRRARPRHARRRGHRRRAQAAGRRRAHPPAVRRPGRDSRPRPPRSTTRPATTTRSRSQVPSDGSLQSLRAVLDRLDAGLDRGRAACPCTPRTSTTSSSPSRAPTPSRRRVRDEHHGLRAAATRRRCCGATCAARCATRPRRPRPSASRSSSCCCSSTSSATRSAPVCRRLRRPRRLPQLRHAGHHPARRRRRGPGRRDLGRDGHDRGHHRPLPDDGHRPRVGAHRPRRRQPDPDAARDRDRRRRRAGARLRPDRDAARMARASWACSRC